MLGTCDAEKLGVVTWWWRNNKIKARRKMWQDDQGKKKENVTKVAQSRGLPSDNQTPSQAVSLKERARLLARHPEEE